MIPAETTPLQKKQGERNNNGLSNGRVGWRRRVPALSVEPRPLAFEQCVARKADVIINCRELFDPNDERRAQTHAHIGAHPIIMNRLA